MGVEVYVGKIIDYGHMSKFNDEVFNWIFST